MLALEDAKTIRQEASNFAQKCSKLFLS